MNTTRIRVTARNDSDARRCTTWLRGSRHNGGKIVFLDVPKHEVTDAARGLDAMPEVASYRFEGERRTRAGKPMGRPDSERGFFVEGPLVAEDWKLILEDIIEEMIGQAKREAKE